jgi:hypothetical protein
MVAGLISNRTIFSAIARLMNWLREIPSSFAASLAWELTEAGRRRGNVFGGLSGVMVELRGGPGPMWDILLRCACARGKIADDAKNPMRFLEINQG